MVIIYNHVLFVGYILDCFFYYSKCFFQMGAVMAKDKKKKCDKKKCKKKDVKKGKKDKKAKKGKKGKKK